MDQKESRDLEDAVLKKWLSAWPFHFDSNTSKKIFIIDTPPPYINADLHVGHAASYAHIDTVARIRRFLGDEVLFPFGVDKNGLPIEVQAEKEYGIDVRKTDRDEYVKKCRELLQKYENVNADVFRRLGFSFNNYKVGSALGDAYETDSPQYRAYGQEIFIKLWNDKKIYEDSQLVNYCTVCKTTLSDAEVEYEEKETKLYSIRVKVDGKNLEIATTRPELIPACAAIAVNPEDQRYVGLKSAIMPITGEIVPVIYDARINKDFGSGLMMVCSYGDKRDEELFRDYDLKEKIIIDENGKIIGTGRYDGLTVSKGRETIISDIKAMGALIGEKSTVAQKPLCWRSKNPVEIIRAKEFYLKQRHLKSDLIRLAGEMKFYKDESRQMLLDWIKSLDRDWPISRTRYYGTEIPLWKCTSCGEYCAPAPGRYYQPWREEFPEKKCTNCGSDKLVGERRILDTWMDSSNSNLFISGYGRSDSFFKDHFPVSLRPQGKDIIRSWLFYTTVKSYLVVDKKPFENVMVTNHAVDESGEKFSKSKGNGVPIKKALEDHGADVIRLWAYLGGDLLEGDIRYSKEKLNEAKRIVNKITNIAKFVGQFKDGGVSVPPDTFDLVFTMQFNNIYNNILEKYENYKFFDAVKTLKDFTINVFADHYIELKKGFAYKNDASTVHTLNHIVCGVLELFNPIIPFITQHLYASLYSKDINMARFEIKAGAKDMSKEIQKIMDYDSAIWIKKQTAGLALNNEIGNVSIPEELSAYRDVLINAHKLKI